MDLTKHKIVPQECITKADYFQRIDFPSIAESFRKTTEAMKELIAVTTQSNEPTSKET